MFSSIHSESAGLLLAQQTGGMLPSSLNDGSWYTAADDALLPFISYREHDATWLFVVLGRDRDRQYQLALGKAGFKSFAHVKAAIDALPESELLANVRAA